MGAIYIDPDASILVEIDDNGTTITATLALQPKGHDKKTRIQLTTEHLGRLCQTTAWLYLRETGNKPVWNFPVASPLDNIPQEVEEMARPTKQQREKAELLVSLEFLAQLKGDDLTALFRKNELVATDGVVTIGVPVTTSLEVCPRLRETIQALRIAGREFQITQLSDKLISLSAGPFTAQIPCIEKEVSPAANIFPDQKIADLNSEFLAALIKAGMAADDKAPRLVESSILCRNGSVVASDGKCLVEIWHGNSFPVVVIPKASATALAKTKKEPIGLGVEYTENEISAITFHFKDGSWLKTQVYKEAWPNVDALFTGYDQLQYRPLPSDIFTAAENLSKFVKVSKSVTIADAALTLGTEISQTLSESLGMSGRIDIDHLLILSGVVDRYAVMQIPNEGSRIYLTGANTRAVVVLSAAG